MKKPKKIKIMKNQNEHYLKYENLLNKLSWSFHNTTGLPFEDLKDEAVMAYCETVNKYREDKGCFSTVLYINTLNALRNHAAYIKRRHAVTYTDEVPDYGVTYDKLSYRQLAEDCSSVLVKRILATIEKYETAFDGGMKAMRGQLVHFLRNEGFSWAQIWDGFREMKQLINQ